VFDPSNTSYQPRGKQGLANRAGLLSTCSGIWQTVWLESVADRYIESLKLVPDINAGLSLSLQFVTGIRNQAVIEAVGF